MGPDKLRETEPETPLKGGRGRQKCTDYLFPSSTSPTSRVTPFSKDDSASCLLLLSIEVPCRWNRKSLYHRKRGSRDTVYPPIKESCMCDFFVS